MNIAPDKKQLYNRIVYVYFCFFSMFVAASFSMNLTYGAALFFSLSALFRMYRFSVKTVYDPVWLKVLKTALTVFFIVSTVYIILLHPFLFPYGSAPYAIVIIILPFLEREAGNLLLRRREKNNSMQKRDIVKILLPVEAGFTIAAGAIALTADLRLFIIVLSGMLLGMVFSFFRQYAFRDYTEEYPWGLNTREVRSARLYDGMVITSGAALNIFAFTYILFISFSGPHDFLFDFLIVFGGLSFVFTAVYLTTYRLVNAPLIRKIGKNAAFILGTAISIFAVYIFRDSWFQGPLVISLQTALLLMGIVLQMAAVIGLKEDILLVLRLYDPAIDGDALGKRTARLQFWTSVISESVFLLVLLVIISNPVFYMMDVGEYIAYAPYVGSSVAAVPAVFLIISLVYSLKQPLTKKFGRRLKAYDDMKSTGKDNPDMEKKLINVLIRKYKKRIGVYIIRAFLKPIMYHTVEGTEHVDELPGVFVFNHGELYGPVAAVVFLPYDIRPWILYKMIDKDEITRHMYTFSKIRFLPGFFKKFIVRALSPIIIWALRSFEPIPVYRGSARKILETFSLSVECLNAGDSILLFPENPEEVYEEKVSSFYSGFASLGRMFYRKTGERVKFYPVFASKRSRTLRIGEGVKFEPGSGIEERNRIVQTLESRITELQRLDEKT